MQDYPTSILHQIAVEGDTFGFAGGAGNVVFFGEFVFELRHEGGFDAAAFLASLFILPSKFRCELPQYSAILWENYGSEGGYPVESKNALK